jgi:hypothetical protein
VVAGSNLVSPTSVSAAHWLSLSLICDVALLPDHEHHGSHHGGANAYRDTWLSTSAGLIDRVVVVSQCNLRFGVASLSEVRASGRPTRQFCGPQDRGGLAPRP